MTSPPGQTTHVDGSHPSMCTARSGRQGPGLTGGSAKDSFRLNPMLQHGMACVASTWRPCVATSSTDVATAPRHASSRGRLTSHTRQPPRHASPTSGYLSGAPLDKPCTNARNEATNGSSADSAPFRVLPMVQVGRGASARRNSKCSLERPARPMLPLG